MSIYKSLISGKKNQIALLIDPDKCNKESLKQRLSLAETSKVSYIFVGGSLLNYYHMDECIRTIKAQCSLPVVIFPGNGMHISQEADAILFLSLISGRNPDLLIGNHVHAAPIIRQYKLESIATGYMIMESGKLTTAQYMSNSMPLPRNKPEVAQSTAIAGEMLGLQALYLDAGSGADEPIPTASIRAIKEQVKIPLIVGGGLRTKEAVLQAFNAGADLVVIGNKAEEDPNFLLEISS